MRAGGAPEFCRKVTRRIADSLGDIAEAYIVRVVSFNEIENIIDYDDVSRRSHVAAGLNCEHGLSGFNPI